MRAQVYVVCQDKWTEDRLYRLVCDTVHGDGGRENLPGVQIIAVSGATPKEHAQIKLLWAKAELVEEKLRQVKAMRK